MVRPGGDQGLTIVVVAAGTSAVGTVTRAGYDANTTMSLVVRADDPITEVFYSTTIPAGVASRRFPISNLAPGVIYHVEVAGSSQDGYATFTSPSVAGTATVTWQSTHPTADNVLLEYGTTSSLGSNVTGTCTAGSCSASIASITRGTVLYLRHTYRDAGNATLAAGGVEPVLIQ